MDALAIGVRGSGGVLQALVFLLLANRFGSEVVGFYGLAVTVTVFSGTLVSIGLPGYLILLNSVRYHRGEHQAFRGNLRFAISATAAVGLGAQLLVVAAMPVGWRWFAEHNVGYRILAAAPTLGTGMGVVLLATYGLRSRNRALVANLLDRPFFHLASLGFFLAVFANVTADDLRASASILAGVVLTAAVSVYAVLHGLAPSTGPAVRDRFSRRLASSYLLSVLVDTVLARTPLLLGSFFFTAADLGSFQIAFAFAASVIVIQEALGGVIGPRFAVFASQGDSRRSLRLHRRSQGVLILMVAPIVAALLRFPDEIVHFVGRDLSDAAVPLAILTVGTAVRCSSGVYRSIFEATGAVAYALYTGAVAIVVLLVGIVALSDRGAEGLALAWAAATISHAVVGYALCEYALRVWMPRSAAARGVTAVEASAKVEGA